jgi:hypothetical protein
LRLFVLQLADAQAFLQVGDADDEQTSAPEETACA